MHPAGSYICRTESYTHPTTKAHFKHRKSETECRPNSGAITAALLQKECLHAVIRLLSFELYLLTISSYYTISVILGTVALSYGSVPMYKMVYESPMVSNG